MIENMRGRSTETKYGRIPLWLYGAGVPLQAIATYGWLHGRYGHYERVMPSYATLAKELGVSRGSVIAYVKALVSVGAVRIETSGAAGQQTNVYAIAFNEPFEVAEEQAGGGQNTDHPVSGLYRAGQNADPGGQPVVHEEDVLKKTKKTLSPRAVPKATPSASPVRTEDERENSATPSNDPATVAAAWTAARGARRNPAAERDVAASAGLLLAAGWPLPDVIALAEDMARRQPTYRDLTRHADHWKPARPATAADSGLPPWCGRCDGEPFAMRWIETDTGYIHCPDCNPSSKNYRHRNAA